MSTLILVSSLAALLVTQMFKTVILCMSNISVLWFKVQSKVNMKYDTWHKEILSKFASRLGDNMQDFYGSVSKVIFCLLENLHFLFDWVHIVFQSLKIISCLQITWCFYEYSTYSVQYSRPVLIWSSKQLKEPPHLMLLASSLLCSHWRES